MPFGRGTLWPHHHTRAATQSAVQAFGVKQARPPGGACAHTLGGCARKHNAPTTTATTWAIRRIVIAAHVATGATESFNPAALGLALGSEATYASPTSAVALQQAGPLRWQVTPLITSLFATDWQLAKNWHVVIQAEVSLDPAHGPYFYEGPDGAQDVVDPRAWRAGLTIALSHLRAAAGAAGK